MFVISWLYLRNLMVNSNCVIIFCLDFFMEFIHTTYHSTSWIYKHSWKHKKKILTQITWRWYWSLKHLLQKGIFTCIIQTHCFFENLLSSTWLLKGYIFSHWCRHIPNHQPKKTIWFPSDPSRHHFLYHKSMG